MTVQLEGNVTDLRAARTVIKHHRLWLDNAKANGIRGNLNDLSKLWNDDEGLEAISIAAGPSLSTDIEKLKASCNGREVCVVDAALRFIIQNGIEPDFVITTDASEKVLTMFTEIKLTKKTKLIANVIANPKVIDSWSGGEIYWFVMANQYYSVAEKKMLQEVHGVSAKIGTKLVPGGNVSSVALSFLLSVRNSKRVYLYGHDFCWKQDMYCGGFNKHLEAERMAEEKAAGTLEEIEDLKGSKVWTNESMKRYAKWHEKVMLYSPNRIVNETSSTILKTG